MSAMRVKFVARKINKIRWRPQSTAEFITGSWDDDENHLSVWKYPSLMSNMNDSEFFDISDPQVISDVCMSYSVTDIKITNEDLVLASSSGGSLMAYKYADEKLHHRHTCDKIHAVHDEPAAITGIATSGSNIATVGEDGIMNILGFNKFENIRKLASPDRCAFTSVNYLRRWEVVAGNILGYLRLWDLRSTSDQSSRTLMVSGDQVGVVSMNVHPTQSHILATGHEDGSLCVWDLRQERRQFTSLAGHTSAISDILFHPINPDVMYTCSTDGTVLRWDSAALRSGTSDANQNCAGNPWLSCDANKHRLNITSLFDYSQVPVNSLDINNSTLLWAADNEALYILPDLII